MKRKFVCTVITLMCLFVSACGNQNDNKETENSTTNIEGTKEDNKDENATNDLTNYYDTTKFVGNPSLKHGVVIVATNADTGISTYSLVLGDSIEEIAEQMENGTHIWFSIDETYGVDGGEVECIIVDNGTPDDFSDDKVAYIFQD